MKKNVLKDLAKHTIDNGIIHESVAKFALAKLSKNDIKAYLFYLKQEIAKSVVYITSAQELSTQLKQKLKDMYTEKIIKYKNDEKIIGGITIQDGDNFIDASVLGTIDQLGNKLKSSL